MKKFLNFQNIYFKKNFNYFQKFKFSIIGMDIGGTNTCMAILEPAGPRVIENSEGTRTTPSYFTLQNSINKDENIIVAVNSKKQNVQMKKNTFYGMKYLFSNDLNMINKMLSDNRFNFDVDLTKVKEKEITENIKLLTDFGLQYDPIVGSSLFLKYCKDQADGLLGKNIKKVVVAIPDFLDNENSKKDLSRSLNLVGLDPIYYIEEAKSSVIAYFNDSKELKNKILVFNLGGSSFNLSYLERQVDSSNNENKEQIINNEIDPIERAKQYKSIFSQTEFIGGDDIDKALVDSLVLEFKKSNKIDISKVPSAMQRIQEAAEKAKIELTLSSQVEINLPFLMADATGPKHLIISISRSKYERIIDDFLSKIRKSCEKFKKNFEETDEILLVGGCSRIPCVQDIIKSIFKKEPNKNLNPEEAPTIGACIIANTLKSRSEEKVSFEKLPLSVGISTIGGKFQRIVDKDSQLPLTKSFKVATVEDNQPFINLNFYQGEREIAEENKLLGNLEMKIPLSKKAELNIEVDLKIDENGLLSIKCTEKTLSNKSLIYSYDLSNGLNPEILEDVIEISKKFKDVDEAKLEILRLKADLNEFLYSFEAELKNFDVNTHLFIKSKELASEIKKMLDENEINNEEIIQKYKSLQTFIEEMTAISELNSSNSKEAKI